MEPVNLLTVNWYFLTVTASRPWFRMRPLFHFLEGLLDNALALFVQLIVVRSGVLGKQNTIAHRATPAPPRPLSVPNELVRRADAGSAPESVP